MTRLQEKRSQALHKSRAVISKYAVFVVFFYCGVAPHVPAFRVVQKRRQQAGLQSQLKQMSVLGQMHATRDTESGALNVSLKDDGKKV